MQGKAPITVAVHACNFLTDFVMEASMAQSVPFCVVPCCHSDHSPGAQLTVAARACGTEIGLLIDAIRMGKAIERGYRVDFKTIPAAISKQNRVLLGRKLLSSEKAASAASSTTSAALGINISAAEIERVKTQAARLHNKQ